MTKGETMSGEFLTTPQLAERWGLTPSAIRQQRCAGRGPRYTRVAGRSVRYRVADVIRYEVSRTVPSPEPEVDERIEPVDPRLLAALSELAI